MRPVSRSRSRSLLPLFLGAVTVMTAGCGDDNTGVSPDGSNPAQDLSVSMGIDSAGGMDGAGGIDGAGGVDAAMAIDAAVEVDGGQSDLSGNAGMDGGAGAMDLAGSDGAASGDMAVACAPPLRVCKGVCVDVATDAKNCGACEAICPVNFTCMMGQCFPGCAMGFTSCLGGCVNLQTDAANCGMCGKACPKNNVCNAGVCALSCPMGQLVCTNACVDPMTDAANCGKCGTACSPGFVCTAGVCVCPLGQTDCNKTCVNVMNDPANCGKCGTACANNMVCMAGACALSCIMPLMACNGSCVDLRSDAKNCGACAKVCPAVPNGMPGCAASVCGVASCNVGHGDCNKNAGDGCEVDLTGDKANCGQCGKACGNGQSCVGGACVDNCSTVAQAYCAKKGWVVSPLNSAWPNQPGGAIYCVMPGINAGMSCETCNTYNELVWKNGAKDACNSNAVLAPGNVYAGHNPCICVPNNVVLCGQWQLNGCYPD